MWENSARSCRPSANSAKTSGGGKSPNGAQELSLKVIVVGTIIGISLFFVGSLMTEGVTVWQAVIGSVIGTLWLAVAGLIVAQATGMTDISPMSGMALISVTLMMFLYSNNVAAAMVVGVAVCVAIGQGADMMQDLKTGFLLGATPYRQQIGELIGAASSALAVAGAIVILDNAYQFGSAELPAPQATLMKTIIEGVLQSGVPWKLVLIGAFLGAIVELCSLPSLPFAVGLYLPLSTMTPIFVGGCIRYFIEKRHQNDHEALEKRRENGILFSSGLIGGEGLLSVGIALYAFYWGKPGGVGLVWPWHWSEIISLTLFALLGFMLVKRTRLGKK